MIAHVMDVYVQKPSTQKILCAKNCTVKILLILESVGFEHVFHANFKI